MNAPRHRWGWWGIVASVAAVVLVALLSAHVSALVHQRRALSEARRAQDAGLGPMTQAQSFSLCISLATVLSGSTTRQCLDGASQAVRTMISQGRPDEARVASSMIRGAIVSSSMPGSSFASSAPPSSAAASPGGSHPLPHASILAREPWSALGAFGALALFVVVTLVVGLGPLANVPVPGRARSRLLLVAICVVLFVAFLVGTGMA